MKELNNIFFKRMFFLAALWNTGIALTGLFFTDFSIALFFGEAAITANFLALLMFKLFMAAIMVFGAGYYLVSLELMLNRGVIWMGLASKLILFVVFIFLFLLGKASLIAMLALTGDFLWSLLFILFLHKSRKSVKLNTIVG